ncbi:hypothetical protein [Nocardia cerradoensis]|uniref:Uncharacterized protein n=2 Tax=Nocardia cerradoensis TaxID=85688 RepID=A0A231GUN7_9NOCA|nr:hypothetical protein [Nocardia cerradoensis]NKY47838.1 hypothetical protein [Nocardia cerradoensis]OXR40191.1 hypothetical protein B7C42_07705 [Nocardia cerradoensis]
MNDQSSEDQVFYVAPCGYENFGPMTCYPAIDPDGVPRLVIHVGVVGDQEILGLSLGVNTLRRLAEQLPQLEALATHIWVPISDD